MFGIGGIASLIKALVILIIIGGIGFGLWHVSNLQANLAISRINQERLQESIRDQQAVLAQMQADVQQQRDINQSLNDTVERQRKDITELNDRFNVNARGEKRDFGTIANAKPGVIEKLVNRGSENALRCFELASGAPLNEKEKNARTSKELNPECPNLVQPLLPSTTP